MGGRGAGDWGLHRENPCRRSLPAMMQGSGRACPACDAELDPHPLTQLLKRFGDGTRVDLVDALPSPFGLVRSGVAPDHPETKARGGVRGRLLCHWEAMCLWLGAGGEDGMGDASG